MAKRIGQGIHECPWDFLRVGVREQPAKSPRSSRRPQPPPPALRRRRRHAAERARPRRPG